MNRLKFRSKFRQLTLASLMGLSVASCDPASQTVAWITGTGGFVVGMITGFGSIYVNGVKYEIDSAEFDIDGQTDFADAAEAQQNLAIGMVVRLEATDNGDGTGTAARVVYDDSVEGPIASIVTGTDPNRLQFTVLGQTVIADQFDTNFEGTSFADLAVDMVVEVSGFIDGDGNILATLVEKKSDAYVPGMTEVELRGLVAGLQPDRFILGSTTVVFDGNTEFEDMQSSDLADGLHVEVKGVFQNDGSILARKIENEDDDLDEITSSEGTIELQGIVYDFVSASDFYLNGVRVDGSALTQVERDALGNGIEIEIKGSMENGVLVATSIEFRGSEAEMKARILSVDEAASTLDVNFADGGEILQVVITAESQLKDDRSAATVEAMNLAQLAAAIDSSSPVEASLSLRREDSAWVLVNLKLKDSVDEYEVEGTVEGFDQAAMTVTLFGMALPLDGIDPGFFASLVAGSTQVELEDTDKDGVFDTAEIEDEDDDD